MQKKKKKNLYLLKYKEQYGGDQNEAEGEWQDTALLSHDEPSIAVEAIISGENFPFSPCLFLLLFNSCGLRGRKWQRFDLLVFAIVHDFRKNCDYFYFPQSWASGADEQSPISS